MVHALSKPALLPALRLEGRREDRRACRATCSPPTCEASATSESPAPAASSGTAAATRARHGSAVYLGSCSSTPAPSNSPVARSAATTLAASSGEKRAERLERKSEVKGWGCTWQGRQWRGKGGGWLRRRGRSMQLSMCCSPNTPPKAMTATPHQQHIGGHAVAAQQQLVVRDARGGARIPRHADVGGGREGGAQLLHPPRIQLHAQHLCTSVGQGTAGVAAAAAGSASAWAGPGRAGGRGSFSHGAACRRWRFVGRDNHQPAPAQGPAAAAPDAHLR